MARRCTCPPPPSPLAACRPVCYRMEMIHGKALYMPPPPTCCCLSSSLLQNGDDPWQGAVRAPPPSPLAACHPVCYRMEMIHSKALYVPPPLPVVACRPVCYRMEMTHDKALYVPPLTSCCLSSSLLQNGDDPW